MEHIKEVNKKNSSDIIIEEGLNHTEENTNAIVPREIRGSNTYKTGEVAIELNVTPAMLGYYCREFAEQMNLSHISGQHRTFSQEDVEHLRYIIYLMKEEKKTAEQTKQYLTTTNGKLHNPILHNEDKAESFMTFFKEDLTKAIVDIIKKEGQANLQETRSCLEETRNCLKEIQEIRNSLINVPVNIEKSVEKISSSILEQQSKLDTSLNDFVNESAISLQNMESLADKNSKNVTEITEQLASVDKKLFDWREEHSNIETNPKKGFFKSLFKK